MRFFVTVLLLVAGLTSSAAGQSLEDLGAEAVPVSRTINKQGEIVWRSSPFFRPATGVVVRGTSSSRELSGWVRFNEGPWRLLYVVFSATEDIFLGGYHGEDVVTGGSYELRFDAPVDLKATGIFDGRQDETATAAKGQAGLDTGGRADSGIDDRGNIETGDAQGVIIPPDVIYRSEWDADPFIGSPVPLARPNYLYLTFHHAAGFGAYSYEEGLEQVKAIQLFHQNGRGWSDIGYHFVMDQSGRIYQGRPFLNGPAPIESIPPLVLGAHAGGHNTGNIGLCVLGCYHPPEGDECTDVLSEPALDSLVIMFAYLSESYGVPPENLRGHRDWGDTACPGDNNYALMDELRDRIRNLLITGNQPIGSAQLAATTDETGVVHLSWSFVDDSGIVSYRIVRAQAGESEVVYEGESAAAGSAVDAGTTSHGSVVYRLYATGSDGREQLLAAVEATLEGPEQYVLAESFPNPFSRATTIRYYLPQDGFVRLAVYDLLGRELAVLTDEHQTGGEWYFAEFDASGLPSGTYFYRLEVEGFSGVVFKETRSILRVR